MTTETRVIPESHVYGNPLHNQFVNKSAHRTGSGYLGQLRFDTYCVHCVCGCECRRATMVGGQGENWIEDKVVYNLPCTNLLNEVPIEEPPIAVDNG